jgi:MerR family copper efflux transcriptional regulator
MLQGQDLGKEASMKISELAAKTGVPVPTIRFYEQVGLLDTRHVRRRENNYRDYSEDALQRLLDLREVQAAAGFTLAELKELAQVYDTGEFITQKETTFLQQKIEALNQKMAELERVQTYLRSKLALVQQKEHLLTENITNTNCTWK